MVQKSQNYVKYHIYSSITCTLNLQLKSDIKLCFTFSQLKSQGNDAFDLEYHFLSQPSPCIRGLFEK